MVREGQVCPVESYFRYGLVGSAEVRSFLHVNPDQAGNRLQVPQRIGRHSEHDQRLARTRAS